MQANSFDFYPSPNWVFETTIESIALAYGMRYVLMLLTLIQNAARFIFTHHVPPARILVTVTTVMMHVSDLSLWNICTFYLFTQLENVTVSKSQFFPFLSVPCCLQNTPISISQKNVHELLSDGWFYLNLTLPVYGIAVMSHVGGCVSFEWNCTKYTLNSYRLIV